MLDLVGILIFGAPVNQEHDFLSTEGLLSLAIVGCLIAPLFETLVLQYAPIRICQISLHWSRRRAIFISALLFGVLHNYNIGYVVAMLGMGLVFAYAFTVFDKKGSNPVLWVTILHTARNVISLIFWYFRQNPHSL
jgi:membrane protease YdiL (CAAX protease family)